jgi:glycosyltransferase involved in cell wall biosynthesis
MAREYTRHGIRCESVRFFVKAGTATVSMPDSWSPQSKWRLLMMGRMMKLKGGEVLLDALIETARRLSRPISVVFAGDGPQRAFWEKKADRIRGEHPEIEISFPGWLAADQRINTLQNTDLMLIPSLWPEPFGMAGPEAGLWGIPSVAFTVGGIPAWLKDGINGRLAANPASPSSLADAIVGCLTDEERYRQLRARARRLSEQLSVEAHYEDLIRVFRGSDGETYPTENRLPENRLP